MKVLVAGAAGQLGAAIVEEWRVHHDVVPLARADLDVTDHAAVGEAVARLRPDTIINCSAFSNVEAAEDQPAAALSVNGLGVRTLARAAADAGALFVHFSSDFVFDGATTRPYVESDPPNPGSVYAASKLLGEWFARDAADHYVLRVESLFGGPAVLGSTKRSSVDRIVEAIAEGREARVFADRTVSPSYAVDVASAARALVERRSAAGLYHAVNSGFCTWQALAEMAQQLLGRKAMITPISIEDLNLRAKRPKFSALSNAKLARAGILMPSWHNALARYVAVRYPGRRVSASP